MVAGAVVSALRRQRRGRLRPLDEAVLLRLYSKPNQYGLQLVENSNGLFGRGTIYIRLSRLEERGMVVAHYEPRTDMRIMYPRRMYSCTDAGRKYVLEILLERDRLNVLS